MTIYRKINPSSLGSSYKEDYEYLLVWLSPFGGVRQWYFSSTEGNKQNNYKNIVIDTISDFRNVPNSEQIRIDLSSVSLNREEFDFVTSIFESNRIILTDKTSIIIPIAIDSATKRTEKVIKDFEVSFKIMLQEPDLMNV